MKNKMSNDTARGVIQQTRSLCAEIDELHARLARTRNEALEEAARVAGDLATCETCMEIVTAIRAQKKG